LATRVCLDTLAITFRFLPSFSGVLTELQRTSSAGKSCGFSLVIPLQNASGPFRVREWQKGPVPKSGNSAHILSGWRATRRPMPSRLNAPCCGGPFDDLVGAGVFPPTCQAIFAHQTVALGAEHALISDGSICQGYLFRVLRAAFLLSTQGSRAVRRNRPAAQPSARAVA
jgi:hypothetical protein